MQQRVEQCPVGIAAAGMDHQAGRLVHYQDSGVLVDDAQRQILWRIPCLLRRSIECQLDLLPAPDLVPRLRRGAIDAHALRPNPFLQATAGMLGEQSGECLVEPQPRQRERDPGLQNGRARRRSEGSGSRCAIIGAPMHEGHDGA